MNLLNGKIALVTGCGQGIGRAIAIMLAQYGAAVVGADRKAETLEDTMATINDAGGEATGFVGDLTDEAFVEDMFAQVEAKYDRLDILVNNAGIVVCAHVDNIDVPTYRQTIETNVLAVYSCTKKAVAIMKKNGSTGKIINIASECGIWAYGGTNPYVPSKFSVRAMTECIAREMASQKLDIAVGCVNPGRVDTAICNASDEPNPDLLRPEQIAAAVLHAVTAPANVNVFETTVLPTFQPAR